MRTRASWVWLAAALGVACALPGPGLRGAVGDEGPARAAVEKLAKERAAFVRDGLRIAERALEDDDPGLARRAARAVLCVAPAQVRAQEILAQVGVEAPSLLASLRDRRHVPRWVEGWTDLLRDGAFAPEGHEGALALPDDGASYVRATRALETGDRWVVELDVRRTGGRAGDAMIGLVFGMGGRSSFSAFVSGGKLVVDESVGGEIHLLGTVDAPPPGPGGWRRLVVIGDAGKIDVWLDGQPLLPGLMPMEPDVSGGIALLRARCDAEVRWLRLGGAK